jgi:hypothetical protein
MEYILVSVREPSQPKVVKLKMRGHKLGGGVYWQGMLSKKWGVTQGLQVMPLVSL